MTEALVIGGSAEARDVLQAILRLHHHRVRGEGQGFRDARCLLQDGFRGAVLLDAELADGQWEDVLQLVKEGGSSPKVILMSPSCGADFESKARLLGAAAVLLRPFEIAELLEALACAPAP